MLVTMWMYLSWIFILLSPGICIILVHLLIKFKLHFLPESVAVVSLGTFFSSAKLEIAFSGFKLYTVSTFPLSHWLHLGDTHPSCPFSCSCWRMITHFFLSCCLLTGKHCSFLITSIPSLVHFLSSALISERKPGSYSDHCRSLMSSLILVLSIFPSLPFMLIYVLLILLINVLQHCARGELRLQRECVKEKTNTAAYKTSLYLIIFNYSIHLQNYFLGWTVFLFQGF